MSRYNSRASSPRNQGGNGKILVPSDDGKRIIGVVTVENKTFAKSNWHSRKHLCRKYNGIGVDRGAFQNYIQAYATLVIVPDLDTGKTYQIDVEDFRQHGIQDDLGWGPQLFCPLKCFQVVMKTAPNAPRQLALAFEDCSDA